MDTQTPDAPPIPQTDWLTQLSQFLGRGSKAIARTPLDAGAHYLPWMQAPGAAPYVPTPQETAAQSAPVATTGFAGLARDAVPQRFKDTAQNVAEGAPRMGADVLSLMSGAGAPLGLADMGAQGYTGMRQAGHGIPASAAVGAGSAAMAGLFGPAEKAAGNVGGSLASKLGAGPTGTMIGRFLGGQTGIGAVGEAQNIGQRTAETGSPTQAIKEAITPEAIFGQIAQQAPFAAMGLHQFTNRPQGITAEGKMADYPNTTAVDQNTQTDAINATETDPQTKILNQFLAGAQKTTSAPTIAATSATPEFPTPTLDEAAPNPEAKLAHDTFIKASGLDKPQTTGSWTRNGMVAEIPGEPSMWFNGDGDDAQGAVIEHEDPEGNYWSAHYGGQELPPPTGKKGYPSIDAAKSAVEGTHIDAGSPQSNSTTEPDFSLINPLGADFGSKAAMSPPVILNSILNGELQPTNAPDNQANVAQVRALHAAFVDDAAQQNGYVNMNDVGHAAELANLQQRGFPLTEPQQAAWARYTPEQQQGAHVAAKILNDPYNTLGGEGPQGGLDPRQWQTDPNFGPKSFMNSVYQAAANMTEKWGRPITTVEDAAALVKDTNGFTKNVNDFMAQNGFGEEAQRQMAEQGVFTPVTQESLKAKFDTFREEYLNDPSAESASRALQWVKNQVWLNAKAAREIVEQRMSGVGAGAPSSIDQRDAGLESAYRQAVSKAPEALQNLLEQRYQSARKEKPSQGGGTASPNWGLDTYRRGVTAAINSLDETQLRKLRDLPTTAPNPEKATTKTVQKKVSTPIDVKGFESTRPSDELHGPANLPETGAKFVKAKETLFTSQEPQRVDVKEARRILDTIRVRLPNENGETIQTNLGKIIYEPGATQVFGRADTKNVIRGQGITPSAAEGATTEDPQFVARQNSLMDRFFQGTPSAPADTLDKMSPQEFKRAFVSILDPSVKSTDKSSVWKNRMARAALVLGKPVEEVSKDGSGDAWLRSFVHVDQSGTDAQKWDWAGQNGFSGERDWANVQNKMYSGDAGKQFMWKARLLGLEPKVGTTPEAVKAAIGSEKPTKTGAPTAAPKIAKDFDAWTKKNLLQKGYQPELAEAMGKWASEQAQRFPWLDNVDFATLTDREGVAQRFNKEMQALGVYLPTQTEVNGKPITNPVIALAEKDLVKNGAYGPLNTFYKLTGLGHEAFHHLQDVVVNNKDFSPTNEDTQTVIDSVHSMEANGASMSPEDRSAALTALMDMVIPAKYSREVKGPTSFGDFLPQVKGFVKAASMNPKEWAASMFQMATAGLATKGSEFEEKGVVRGDKLAREHQDALSYFSPDTIAFMRGQYRWVGDSLDQLQKVLDDPEFREQQGLTYGIKKEVPQDLSQGDVVNRRTYSRDQKGQLSTTGDVPSLPAGGKEAGTAQVPVPKNPTLGMRTRSTVEAALRVGESRAGSNAQPRVEPPVPTHIQVLRKLAAIDPGVERAATLVKQLITKLGDPTGQGKTVDLTDVRSAKDFMSSVGGGEPPEDGTPWKNPVDAAGEESPEARKYSQNIFTRFLSPMQYRMSDLGRRGLDVAQPARQNIDRVYSNATTIANNIRGAIVARVGTLGRYGLDPKTGYFKFFHDQSGEFDSAANVAMSKIALKQQKLGGVDITDPKMAETVADAIKGLPKEQAQYAVSAVKDMNKVYRTAMASQIKAQQEHEDAFTARLIMKQNPGKYNADNALQTAKLVSRAAQGDLAARQELLGHITEGSMSPQSLSTVESVGVAGFEKVQKLLNIAKSQGNFMSEGRFGRYMVYYKTPEGKNGSMGFNEMPDAQEFANARNKEGASNIRFVDKRQLSNEQFLASNADGIDAIKNLMQTTFQKQLDTIIKMDPVNGPKIAEELAKSADPSKAIDNYTITNSLQKLTAFKRKLSPGREYLNPVATMEEYTATSARGIARRAALDKHALYMEDLKAQGLDKVAKDLDTQMNERLAPSNETTSKLTTIGTAAYIGADVARSVVDSTLGFTLGIPTMIQEGCKVAAAHGYYMNGMKSTARSLLSSNEFNASAKRGYDLENASTTRPAPLSADPKGDVVNHYLQRMNDEGRLARAPIVDTLEKDTEKLNLEKAARVGNYEPTKLSDLAISPFYNVSKALLRAHSWLPSFNQKISAHAALSYAYDSGLRGEALYSRANDLLDSMTAASGKGNKPVGYAYVTGQGSPGSEFRRSAVSFATMMQTYGLSQTFGLAHMLKDSVGATPGLSSEQRIAATKAAGYGLLTNTALAGTLGLTGVAYMFAAINKVFHKDPEAAVREGLQSFYNKFIHDDGTNGHLFADTAMNGLANRLTGLDFAGRSGVSSLFGIGAGGETSMMDMFGPTAGLIDNLVQGVSDVEAGKPWLGAREIAPRALKPLVEMYGNYKQFGDLRIGDQNNNLLMKPNAAQAIGYAMGFAPAGVRSQRQESRLMSTAQDNYTISRDAQITNYARAMLSGNGGGVMQEAYARQFTPGFNPKDFIDQVTDRALDLQTQKDPMTHGSVLNAQSQDAIGSTFDNPKVSEMQRLQMKQKLQMQLGMPFGTQPASSQDYLKAMLVDQLRQQRGMGRGEALAVIQRYFGL